MQVIEVVETVLDRLGHGNRLRVGERAEVAAGAGDDVGEQADVRRREPERPRLAPQRRQIALAHVGEDQVLLVRHAQLAEGIAVGEAGDRVHLVAGDVARRHAGLLEREGYRGIARDLVPVDVALLPVFEAGAGDELHRFELLVLRPDEAGSDALDVLLCQGIVLHLRPLGVDLHRPHRSPASIRSPRGAASRAHELAQRRERKAG